MLSVWLLAMCFSFANGHCAKQRMLTSPPLQRFHKLLHTSFSQFKMYWQRVPEGALQIAIHSKVNSEYISVP